MNSKYIRLSDIADVQGGFAFKSKDFGSTGTAIVKIANIQPPQVSLDGVDRIEDCKLTGLERFELQDGDILMAMTGATVGKVARFKKSERAFLNQRVARITAKNGEELNNFIYALVSLPGFDEKIEKASAGSAQANISAAGIGSLEIPLLDHNTQLFIGWLARKIDDRINLLRETNTTLEAIAQALFKSWFVDFDPVHANAHARAQNQNNHPQAVQQNPAPQTAEAIEQNLGLDAATAALFPDHLQDSDLGPIPAGWEYKQISDLIDVRDGTHDSPKPCENGHPLVTSKNILEGFVDTQNTYLISEQDFIQISKRSRVDQFDVLISMIGTVGYPAIVLEKNIDYAIKNVGLFKTSVDKKYAYFVYLFIRHAQAIGMVDSLLSGTTQKYISLKQLRGLKVLKVPDACLTNFNAVVGALFEKMQNNRESLNSLTQLRDTLLPRLIAGTMRLPDAEAQIEAVVGGV